MSRIFSARRAPRQTSGLAVVLMLTAALGVLRPDAVHARTDDLRLIVAVKGTDEPAVRRLLDAGVDVNGRQPDGATALHWAAFRDHLAIAGLLLEAGADVNAVNELGATALWLAADNGSAPMVQRLLSAGATVNVALPEGETPLMTAARTGSAEVVRALLHAGAEVNVAEESRGQTALMWAVAQGHPAVIAVLLAHGADTDARSRVRPRMMHADNTNASQYDQGVIWNRGGFTPLLFAARHGRIDAATQLLAAGADIDLPAPTGASPLVLAAHSGREGFAQYLLEAGADPNAVGAGYTTLHAAVLRGNHALVRSLLAHGADPNLRLRSGTPLRRASQDWALNPSLVSATPYWLAAYYHDTRIMHDLVAAGADPTLSTRERWRTVYARAGGEGPPHVAGGFVPPLVAVLRGPANRGRFFNTSLRDPDAEEQETREAVLAAINFGADVNAADLRGDTPLHGAAQRNFTTIIRLLAERGANVNAEDKAGRTPLDLAKGVEAIQARLQDPTRYPSGNGAAVLRELGAEDLDDETADQTTQQ